MLANTPTTLQTTTTTTKAYLAEVKTPPEGGNSAMRETEVKTLDEGEKSVKITKIFLVCVKR